ncbi:MAG: S8 family serine peptidase [Parvularculaceae bacterium]|nr:S8 family serine peptidase [Parvularculaceae bacterium]
MPLFRPLLAAILFALVAGCETYVLDPPSQSAIERDENEIADERIVVLVRTREAEDNLVSRAKRRGYRLLERETLASLNLTLLTLRPPASVSRKEAIRELERLEPSATAGVNHRYRIQSGVGVKARTMTAADHPGAVGGDEEGLPRRFAEALIGWPDSGCPAGRKVGIVDTAHSESFLKRHGGRVVDRLVSPGLRRPESQSHADLIGELMIGEGRLRDAQLYTASVLSAADDASAGVVDIIRAIDWLGAQGVTLINVSLAGPYNKILDRAVQRAANLGTVIVAAAGNVGPDAPPQYPAAFEKVIAVTAIDVLLKPFEQAARGEHIDFAAPGVDVFVGAGSDGVYVSGTSFAAPFVTARIAVQSPPSISYGPQDAMERLGAEALDLGPPGPDPIYGRGLIRAPATCRRASAS